MLRHINNPCARVGTGGIVTAHFSSRLLCRHSSVSRRSKLFSRTMSSTQGFKQAGRVLKIF